VEEFLRGHDPVTFEDEPVFHDEVDSAKGVDVLERISLDGDDSAARLV
jgi:hypothetical protein